MGTWASSVIVLELFDPAHQGTQSEALRFNHLNPKEFIMARTTTKPLKSTIVDAPVKDEQAGFSFSDMLDGFKLPSGKRVIVSFIVSVIAGGCTLYLGMQLTAVLAVGAGMLTGSAFLAFIAMFLGYALSILATVVLSGKVQSFILSGDIDRTYETAKSKVTGWFGAARDKASSFTTRVAS